MTMVNGMQKGLVATCVIFSVLPVLATALRVLSHRLVHRTLNASDYCALASAILAVGLNAGNIVSVYRGGLGADGHQDHEALQMLQKLFTPLEFLWAVSLRLSKVLILLLYCRLFRGSYVVVTARLLAAVIVAWAVATVLSGLFICRPISPGWTPDQCGEQVTLYFSITGAINMGTDIMVLILPLSHIYRLRLPKTTKLGLAIVMNLGVVTCIISINRLIYISKITPYDMTGSFVPVAFFSVLEPSMAVTLACVPLLKPLVGLSRRRSRRRHPTRVIVAGNSQQQRSHRYDPEYAGRIKLRPDMAEHRAQISTAAPGGGDVGDGGDGGVVRVPERSYDSSSAREGARGADITVNTQWKVTRDAGEWTQILGGR